MKLFVLILATFVYTSVLHAQVWGCMDPQANNYNAAATNNDGSCQYPYTAVTPTHLTWLNNALIEISGHCFVGNNVWAHEDSGNPSLLFKVDTLTGNNIDSINLSPIANYDWEDITTNDSSVFIGDFGNNDGTRQNLKIYRIKQQDLIQGNVSFNVDIIAYAYSNQTSFSANAKTNFDCEAFIAMEDSIYLFSKNWGNHKTYVYRLPNTVGTHIAELIDSFDVNGLITSAAYHKASGRIVLLGYDTTGNSFVWILSQFLNRNFFSGNKRRLDFGIAGGQAEGIAFIDSNRLLMSNEKYSFFNPRFATINIADLFNPSLSIKSNTKPKDYQIIQADKKLLIQSQRIIQAIEIYTMNGEKKLHDRVAKQMKKVDLLEFVPGKYLIRMFYDDKVSVSELFLVK